MNRPLPPHLASDAQSSIPDPWAFQFGSFRLQPRRRELLSNGTAVPLGSRAIDLLLALIRRQGKLATKDELMIDVWPGSIVEENNLHAQISALRKVLANDAECARCLQTVSGRGYRFVAQVERLAGPGDASAMASDATAMSLPLPDKPSIAVLPFSNMSADPDQEYFADGVVEDITTELARFGDLFVIARNSSFQYKDRAIDVREVGRDLGVRYVLEGSVRRADHRVRISAQLVDAQNGSHVWAEKYDHPYGDILGLQDVVTRSVVAAIQPEILAAEGLRASRKRSVNLDALECCMRGMWHFHKSTPDDNRQGESWIRRAIELDATLARAHTMLARVLAGRCWFASSDNIDRDLQESQAAAERGLSLDDHDSDGYFALSILSLMMRRHDRALAAAHKAIDVNPNFAHGFFALGETHLFRGQFSEALGPLVQSLRLTPRDPFGYITVSLIALTHYHLENYTDAVTFCERALQKCRFNVVLRTLAATLGQLGRIEDAHPVIAEMGRLMPANARRHWELTNPYADPSDETRLLDGLRKAGWERPAW